MTFPKELVSLLSLLLKSCCSFASNTANINLYISLPLMEQGVTNYIRDKHVIIFFKMDVHNEIKKTATMRGPAPRAHDTAVKTRNLKLLPL